uniref:DUF4283 domain-containing protein n=1 Tax=Setaria viridis TaxID=4556 RepID=A0A4U6VS20_SETVI|nr:hypothetical protein SEVIR_2G181600v2 [Setaria viridis]
MASSKFSVHGWLSDLDFSPGLEIQRLYLERYGSSDFNVVHLAHSTFRFYVHSKAIGLLVYKMRSFKCVSFAIFFALWRAGGPNWDKEHASWISEQEVEWTCVQNKSSKKSYEQAAHSAHNSHEIRCKSSFRYGHIAKSCRSRKMLRSMYRPKLKEGPSGKVPNIAKESDINLQAPPSANPPPSASSSPPRYHSKPSPNLPAPQEMANFAIDPQPQAPRGFEVLPHHPNVPALQLFAYLGSCLDPYNDDIAITMLFTPDYQLHFIKHDEAENARVYNLDREAWVMLMGYPLDARNNSAVAKLLLASVFLDTSMTPTTVLGLRSKLRWHDTNYHARIAVRIYLNDDAKILHNVVVSVGLPPRVRSWTCPIFALKKKNATFLADEDLVPPEGPLHPLPMDAPHWMGLNPAVPSSVEQGPGHNAEGKYEFQAPSGRCYVRGCCKWPIHATPAKRRSRKLKEPLDDVFLHHSKRLNSDLGGFCTEESAVAAAENPNIYVMPLEVIHPIYSRSAAMGSSAHPASLLLVEIIHSVAIVFLQMQPSTVSASALLELDDNDNEM